MKKRISATVEEETIKKMNKLLKEKSFRNKSHLIEMAICMLFRGKNGK